jgi:hypothetical protein
VSHSPSISQASLRISHVLAWLLFATALLAIVAVSALSLPVPNIGFAQDLGIMVDAGWRFYQGLKTHADFSSPLGPLLGILFGLPFFMAGPEYAALRFLPAVVTMLASLWSVWLVGNSVNVWVRTATSLAIGLFAGGIFHAGFDPQALSFATFYNRVGFGLLCLTGLSFLLPQTNASDSREMLISVSGASGLALMFLLKVNFFVAGLGLLGLSLATRSWTKRGARIMIYAGLAWAVVAMYLIGFRPDLMLRDWAMAASARGDSHAAYFFPLRNLLSNVTTVALLMVCSSLLWPEKRTRAECVRNSRLLLLLWAPAILGYALTLSQSHGDGRGIPTAIVGLVALAATLRSERPNHRESSAVTQRVLAVCALVVASMLIAPNFAAYAHLASVSRGSSEQQFEAAPLAVLRVGPYNNWGEKFAELTNEGTSLLARHCRPEDSLQYVDMANMFSFASGQRTPRGSPLWWDAMATFSLSLHPNLSAFDDTLFIMLPNVPLAQPPQKQWMELYGRFLAENYREVEATQHFRLFRRHTP